jgi:hypothetical protein
VCASVGTDVKRALERHAHAKKDWSEDADKLAERMDAALAQARRANSVSAAGPYPLPIPS